MVDLPHEGAGAGTNPGMGALVVVVVSGARVVSGSEVVPGSSVVSCAHAPSTIQANAKVGKRNFIFLVRFLD